MKLLLCLFFTFLVAVLAKNPQQKTYVVSYPNDAPESILSQAKSTIEAAVRLTPSNALKDLIERSLRVALSLIHSVSLIGVF